MHVTVGGSYCCGCRFLKLFESKSTIWRLGGAAHLLWLCHSFWTVVHLRVCTRGAAPRRTVLTVADNSQVQSPGRDGSC